MSNAPSTHEKYLETSHLEHNLTKRSVRGGIETLFAQAVRLIVQIVSTVWLARLLPPEDFGLVGMVTAITGFILLFNDLGLGMPVIQYRKITHEQVSTLFWVNLSVSVLLCLLTVALSSLIAKFYGEPRLAQIAAVSAIGFVFAGLAVQHQALLRRQMKFRTLRSIEIASSISGATVGLLAANRGFGYWALVWMPLVTGATFSLGSWLGCWWRPNLTFQLSAARSMLKVGGNITGFNVVNYFARNADNLLIGRYWGAQVLGLYATAYKLVLLPIQQLNAPLASVAVPALSRLQDSPLQYREAYTRFLALLCAITVPVAVLVMTVGDALLVLVIGEKWAEAGIIFRWLGVAMLTQPIGNTTGWLFITQDRSNDMLRWGFIGSATAVGSIVLGLPWGALGVAISYAMVGLFVRAPLLYWFVGKRGPVKQADFYRSLFPVLLPAGTAMLAVSLTTQLSGYSGWSLVLSAVLQIAAVFLIWLGSPLGTSTRKTIKWLYEILQNR